MAIIYGTLAKELDGKVDYVYPKTVSEMVEYDSSTSVKDKIDKIDKDIVEVNARVTNMVTAEEDIREQLKDLVALVNNIQKDVEEIKKVQMINTSE